MIVNVRMKDNYVFILCPDDEVVELIHQICKVRKISAVSLVDEIMLGGLTMQSHLFICPIKPEDKLWRYRWFNLLNIFKLLGK